MSYHTIQCLSYAIYLCVTGTEGWPAVRTTLSSRWPELVCTVLCLMKKVRYLMIQHPIVPASVTYLLSLWRMISTDRHKKDLGFQISRLIICCVHFYMQATIFLRSTSKWCEKVWWGYLLYTVTEQAWAIIFSSHPLEPLTAIIWQIWCKFAWTTTRIWLSLLQQFSF